MNNKKLILLNLCIAGIVLLLWWVTSNWAAWKKDDALGMQLVAVLSLAIVFGLLFVTVVLPNLGDRIGEFFYSAPEKIEPDSYSKAAAKVTQGDYEGAIEAYKHIAAEEPENRFPIIEIAKIQQDHLGDVDGAINTLEDALESQDWEVNHAAFLIFRLHDLYLHEKKNEPRARELLHLVIEKFPDTRHSANAHHKLNEMNAIG